MVPLLNPAKRNWPHLTTTVQTIFTQSQIVCRIPTNTNLMRIFTWSWSAIWDLRSGSEIWSGSQNTDQPKSKVNFHLIWTLPPCFCCHFLYFAIASKKLYLKSKSYVSVFGDCVVEKCISKVHLPPNLHICCRHQLMQVWGRHKEGKASPSSPLWKQNGFLTRSHKNWFLICWLSIVICFPYFCCWQTSWSLSIWILQPICVGKYFFFCLQWSLTS